MFDASAAVRELEATGLERGKAEAFVRVMVALDRALRDGSAARAGRDGSEAGPPGSSQRPPGRRPARWSRFAAAFQVRLSRRRRAGIC